MYTGAHVRTRRGTRHPAWSGSRSTAAAGTSTEKRTRTHARTQREVHTCPARDGCRTHSTSCTHAGKRTMPGRVTKSAHSVQHAALAGSKNAIPHFIPHHGLVLIGVVDTGQCVNRALRRPRSRPQHGKRVLNCSTPTAKPTAATSCRQRHQVVKTNNCNPRFRKCIGRCMPKHYYCRRSVQPYPLTTR